MGIRTRNYISNPLLCRKQFVLDVHHPGRASVSKVELRKIVAKMYNVQDDQTIFLFGFRTQFGGGKSSGFGLIYDSVASAKCYEPRYRLMRVSFYKQKKKKFLFLQK